MNLETIDDLTQANNLHSDSNNSLSSLHFRILLTTLLSDRMAYYGLRAVAVLYVVEQFQVPRDFALSHYGYFTSLVYISVIIGGFFGDLILGARNGIFLGFGLCLVGAVSITVPDPLIFYIGCILVALGSGFIRPNTFSLIGHGTSIDKKFLLEKRFISVYAAINLGAFLSTLIISYIGETYSYIYSFILVIILYALSFGLTFIINPKKNSTILNNWEVSKPPRPVTKSLFVITLTIIASSAFWMIFELYSFDISLFKVEFLRSHLFGSWSFDLFLSISTVVLLFIAIPYYFVAKKISLYLKVGIGMALIGLSWIVATMVASEVLSFGFATLFVMSFIEALAEMFVSPIALTLLSLHTTKRYYGIVFSAYTIFIFLGMRLFTATEISLTEYIIQIGLILVIIASVVLYSILAYNQRDKGNPNLEN